MIDQGIVMLVNSMSSPPFVGGFDSELPKDYANLPNYTYKVIYDHSDPGLLFFNGLNKLMLQIDCYGRTAVEALGLASKIDAILDGYHGILPDPDSTFVNSCFGSDRGNFFDDAPRSYRRMLEYTIFYAA